MNKIDAYVLCVLGKKGLNQEATAEMNALLELDPCNTKIDFFRKLGWL